MLFKVDLFISTNDVLYLIKILKYLIPDQDQNLSSSFI